LASLVGSGYAKGWKLRLTFLFGQIEFGLAFSRPPHLSFYDMAPLLDYF